MKIKLHKKLRSVLSVLVAFMLLVGVMPTAVWNGIIANAVDLTERNIIYFDTGANAVDWAKDSPMYIGYGSPMQWYAMTYRDDLTSRKDSANGAMWSYTVPTDITINDSTGIKFGIASAPTGSQASNLINGNSLQSGGYYWWQSETTGNSPTISFTSDGTLQSKSHFIVYFDKELCGSDNDALSGYNNNNDTPVGIHFWGRSAGSPTATTKPIAMDYVDGSYEFTGHHIFKYDFGDYPPTGIIFTEKVGSWTNQSPNIENTNLKSGYVYYVYRRQSNNTINFLKSEYTPVSLVPYGNRIMSATENIPDRGSVFEKDTSGNIEYYKSTFYDYFSDYELRYGKSRVEIAYDKPEDAFIKENKYGYDWNIGMKYVPTLTLNRELSLYYQNAGITYPIYFGNFSQNDTDKDKFQFAGNKEIANKSIKGMNSGEYFGLDPYIWYNDTNAVSPDKEDYKNHYGNFYYGNNSQTRVNASNVVSIDGNVNTATQGLYGSTLSGGKQGNLLLADDTTPAPFFSTWLTDKKLGAIYDDVDMPFFKNGDYWEYDSSKSNEAVRMRRYTEGGQTKYCLDTTNKGINGWSGNGKKNTYDFFPFSDKDDLESLNEGKTTEYYFDQINYNFGFSVTIPFSLTSNGTVTGNSGDTPITFEFSGDDDLVAYLDGDLVLDIGGDHGAVTGTINFATLESTVSRVKQPDSTTDETNKKFYLSSVLDKNNDGDLNDNYTEDGKTYSEDIRGDNKIHYLKIFCMERGLFESNVKITHNLPTIQKRSFTVDTVVDTSNVDSIFTDQNTTAGVNFVNNINMIDFDIDVKFSKANDASTYELVTFGDTPNVYKTNVDSQTTTTFGTDPANKPYTYSFLQKHSDDKIMLYVNDFIQKNDYYLKVSEESGHQLRFNSTDITGKKINDLFACSWDLRLQSAASSSGTSGNSTVTDNNVPDTFGPVHTTASGSRPARGTKTTSTSTSTATNTTPYFDFNGTVDEPDQIVFINTIQTKTLTITKNFNDSSGLAENTEYTFSVTVTFDNVGGSDIKLEEPRDSATGALDTSGSNVTVTTSRTFTLTKTESSASIDIAVPINTDVTIEETGIASGKEPTYSRNGILENSPNTTYTFNMGTTDQSVVISNPGPTKPIILKVQKVWENVQKIPANTSVSFKVERKIGTGSWTAVGGNAKTADSVPYTVTYDSANGKVTFTNSSEITSSNDGKVIWTAYIYDPDNLNENTYQYRVTEYKNTTEMYDPNETFVVNSVTLKVKYDVEGLLNNGSYHDETENAPANPSGDTTNYSTDEDTERILTLSVINRAFIKIRVQSYFTQTDEAQQNGLPTGGVKLKVQRRGSSGWETVLDSNENQVQDITITEHSADNAPTPRQFYSYVLTGQYDPDYDYRVLEYADDGTTLITDTSSQSFSTVFNTVSYNGGGGIKNGVHVISDGLDQENGSYVILTDTNSNSGYGITMAILNSASGTIGGADTGGRGDYLPIAGGFVTVLLAGAFFFIYKKRFLV